MPTNGSPVELTATGTSTTSNVINMNLSDHQIAIGDVIVANYVPHCDVPVCSTVATQYIKSVTLNPEITPYPGLVLPVMFSYESGLFSGGVYFSIDGGTNSAPMYSSYLQNVKMGSTADTQWSAGAQLLLSPIMHSSSSIQGWIVVGSGSSRSYTFTVDNQNGLVIS